MKSKRLTQVLACLIGAIALFSCKKLVEVNTPKNQLTTDKVFADSTSATAAVIGIYALYDKYINNNYNKFMGLYTDELTYTSSTQGTLDYVKSLVPATNTPNLNYWKYNYASIYQCNDIIEQLQKSTALSSSTVLDFTNEAKFLRAYAYFHLVNVYGSVPLVISTDVNVNATIANSDSASVYKQIVRDLKDAQSNLSINYRGAGRVRANKYAATALLSKVYLWQKDWVNAESSASAIINSSLYTPLPAPAQAFLANSKETILSFWTQNGFVSDASSLIPSSGAPGYFFTTSLVNAFELGDLRKSNWIKTSVVSGKTYYSPYKYKNRAANTSVPEYLIALRAGEQYLIRAEARAQQGNISGSSGAIADLNVIRTRAGLGNYSEATDQSSVVAAIRHEKQVELFTEWGNRFLDLKRTGGLNAAIGSFKSTWKPNAIVLPIPQNELNTNPNLTQNQGY
ncbi:RagB/SusD family nutrient uptake outer membrane protein [Mucilaginibacter sp.]|jgi:hypothetical protein|uniref:RagB/SusD family nutrient uptake outer membrane protein n=1 Tax=Mucilaginibacter sp. TaxID=1882438 RepID=UPI0035675BD6